MTSAYQADLFSTVWGSHARTTAGSDPEPGYGDSGFDNVLYGDGPDLDADDPGSYEEAYADPPTEPAYDLYPADSDPGNEYAYDQYGHADYTGGEEEYPAEPGPSWPAFDDLEAALAVLPGDDRITDLLTGLNPDQFDAVRTLLGPVLVVAGPGSGKTRVLTHRVAALARLGVKPWNITAVTFTNKAAGEMRERIAALVGDTVSRDMWVSTFHSACVRVLRKYHDVAGLPRSFTILDASDAQRVVKNLLAEEGAPAEASTIKEITNTISRAKNDGLTPNTLAQSRNPAHRTVAPYFQRYQDRLTQMGAVDFDDLLVLAVRVLRHSADALAWIRRKAQYLLVDEFQDTNPIQLQMLRLMCPPGSHTVPAGPYTLTDLLRAATGNLCVVGDADQSIYAFRGATPEGMAEFGGAYPGASVVILEENYRSTRAILDVVRALIAPNPALHRPKLTTANPVGEPVRRYEAVDDRDEADWILAQIKKYGGRLDEHAVLFRTNSQTRVFEEALTRAALPYQVVGGTKFYERAEIKDALSYLRVAVNPADAVNLARCVNTPRRGIGDATVDALLTAARAAGTDPITHLRDALAAGTVARRSTAALEAFLGIYDTVAVACHTGPADALRAVAATAGLRAELKKDKTSGIDRVENLDELISGAEEFLTGPSPTSPHAGTIADLPGWEQTLAYLENVALVSSVDDNDETAVAKISLLTAHASKGKEWPHVYVAGVENGLYPHERSRDDEAGIEEERRLLFVACSRAQVTLTLSHCQSRYMFNRPVTNAVSPFLDDLPATVQTVVSRRGVAPQWNGNSGSGYGRGRVGTPVTTRTAGRTGAGGRSAGTYAPRTTTGRTAPGRVVPSGPRLSPATLTPDTTVRHPVFGTGTVVSVAGSTARIRFGEQVRTLDLNVAPLTLA